MTGSTTQPVTTQTTTSTPWSGVQPYLQAVYGTAEGMRVGNQGYQPYPGTTVAPLDPNLNAALSGQILLGQGLGASGLPGVAGAQNLGAGLMNTYGLTPDMQNALSGLGTAATNYGTIFGQANAAANPYLQATIDAQNLRGNAAIQSAMSGAGRYGSGQMQDVMARAQAQVADPLLMQDYEARQNRAL